MQKRTDNSTVTPFSFAPLDGPATGEDTKTFVMPSFDKGEATRIVIPEKVIRAEREAESRTQFKMDEIVRDSRGLSSQEKGDIEKRIAADVSRRVQEEGAAALSAGREQGRAEGKEEALAQAMAVYEQQTARVEELIKDLADQCQQRLLEQKSAIYEMTKRTLKWLVLKEVGDETYLPRLLEKLILEMNQRANLIIKVHPDDFSAMPGMVEALEKRLGALSNLRVEPALDMKGRGIIIETENGLIDGTPDAMFETLDKLYASVVGHDGG